MSQEPPNPPLSPQPKNKRKSRSRRGSEGISPKKSPPPPFWQNIINNLLRGISELFETGAIKLPTLARIGIIGAIVAIAIWAISTFFSAKPNQVANITTTPETPVPNIERGLETEPIPGSQVIPLPSIEETPLPQPETEPIPGSQVVPLPSIEETLLPQPETKATAVPEETLVPSIEETPLPQPETKVTAVPEETLTPAIEETPLPQPETEVTPTPIPPKKIVLTPEQALIVAIENKVTEISDRIAPGLIQSTQANFRTSSLTVMIDDQWYDLSTSEQRKLGTEMLQCSQELDFSHLEIMDAQKRLVARNPVVGTEIILFTPVSKS